MLKLILNYEKNVSGETKYEKYNVKFSRVHLRNLNSSSNTKFRSPIQAILAVAIVVLQDWKKTKQNIGFKYAFENMI